MPKSLLGSWPSQLGKVRMENEEYFCHGWSFYEISPSMTPANTGSQIPFLMQYHNEVQQWLDWGTGLRGTGMGNRRWAAQDQAALYLLSDCWDTVAINPLLFSLGAVRKETGKRRELCRSITCHKRKRAQSPGVTSYWVG